ncbi:MAG TPA: hypothetical protein VF266_10565 [Thermoanaerobaculia bacterium]
MHKLTRTCTVLLLAAIVAAPAAHGACRALFADGPELWITNADGDATRLLREERDVAMARFSPDRERIAYVRGFDLTGEVMSHIVVMRPGSEETVEIPIRAELGITDVMNLGWLDEKRVWTEGHVTPSSGMYHEWDVATGKVLTERLGAWFAPSPDGASLAYREHVPHGAPASLGDRVLVNERVVFPADDDTRPHRVRGITWSGSGQLTVADEVGGERSNVVVDLRRGGASRRVTVQSNGSAAAARKPMYVDLATHRLIDEASATTVEPLDLICD